MGRNRMRSLLVLVALITAVTRVALTQSAPPAEPSQSFDVWLAAVSYTHLTLPTILRV